MRILELELSYFKGLRSLRLLLNGNDARIFGDNATGKTTIMDGFLWLLTGKDHTGSTNFSIKTLDEEGNAIPYISHSVRARLEHNGDVFELIRSYSEVWQKKNGTNTETFTGHKTEYFLNGVPKAEKDYQAVVDRMVPPQLLRLLSAVGYFNEQIKPDERRKMLIDMFGDIRDSDILVRPAFEELKQYVSSFVTVADLKKQKTVEKTKINDELKSIPIKIDTHTRYLNCGGLNATIEQIAVDDLSNQISVSEADYNGLYSGEYINGLKSQLEQLRADHLRARNEAESIANEKRSEIRKRMNALEDDRAGIMGEMSRLIIQDNGLVDAIKRLAKRKDDALQEYNELFDMEFSAEQTCPTCGQAVPDDRIKAARAQFNENKAMSLEENISAGKGYAAEIEAKEKSRKEIADRMAELRKLNTDTDNKFREAEAEMYAVPVIVHFDESPLSTKASEINAFNDSVSERGSALREQIRVLKEQKAAHERNLSALKNAEVSALEIKVLEQSEKTLTAKYEDCEKIISLCDEFAGEKVKLLDEKISGAFKFTKFKLSEAQVNGGFKDVCEATINGVPYSAANNAARINCGLDIIETFSKAYGVTTPIFIDNAESVTQLNTMDSCLDKPQIIQLIVSEQDKTLRIEVI